VVNILISFAALAHKAGLIYISTIVMRYIGERWAKIIKYFAVDSDGANRGSISELKTGLCDGYDPAI
jgi:hypothetical protein